jgi:ABC-type transport system involved in multi-copper enzyme maturation permease subunit
MNAAIEIATPEKLTVTQVGWPLWLRQIRAIFRLEIRKNFLNRRAVLIYLLAFLPVILLLVVSLIALALGAAGTQVVTDAQGHVISQTTRSGPFSNFSQLGPFFAAIYGALILRTVVFFGCAWIFMNLFRGEVVDRSLHYYFLSPVRREVLIVGKYFSGIVTSAILFTLTTVVSMLLVYFPNFPSESSRFFFDGQGLGQLLTYAGITVLACIGYGAFFLVVGLFFRNPIVPALLLYGWEWLNFLLPPLLKKVSVIHYLNSLVPIQLSQGPFAVIAEPTPAWMAISSLLIVTALVLIGAAYRIRHLEIKYGD